MSFTELQLADLDLKKKIQISNISFNIMAYGSKHLPDLIQCGRGSIERRRVFYDLFIFIYISQLACFFENKLGSTLDNL